MEKVPFRIVAEKKSPGKALIRITGEIGWDVDADGFRREVDMLVAAGVTDVHLYLNGPGGSCFDAAEIVNILSSFTGEVTGEGGALVASAYTYIAMHCKTFVMPANGQFMVHRPKGCAAGTTDEILAYHKLLSDVEAGYLAKYKERVKDAAVLEAKWKTDWWMTAAEAAAAGFITAVKDQAKIDRATARMIAACGCPQDIELLINTKEDMDLKAMAVALGIPEGSTEEEVRARIDANKKAAERLEGVERAAKEREKNELAAKVKARLDKAVADKVIKADVRADWEGKLTEDFEGGCRMLDGIAPAARLSDGLKAETTGGKTTVQGKTFEQLQDEEPETLAALEKEQPEVFASLFADWKKRNKI